MLRDAPFLEGNIHHIYNRGANKARIFLDDRDYFRFQLLLFLANSQEGIHLSYTLRPYQDVQGRSLKLVFLEEKPAQGIVDVLGYTLIPNHFHLILRQKAEDGISKFMKKLGTAYSMYFNTKYDHSGTVFQGRFKSKHVDTGDYLRWLFAYIFLNPIDMYTPDFKEKEILDKQSAFDFLKTYPHSSFFDMRVEEKRPEAVIINFAALEELRDDVPVFENIEDLIYLEASESQLVQGPTLT